MDLIIHILIFATILGIMACFVIAMKIIGDLEILFGKLNRRIATLEHNNSVLVASFRKNSIKVVEDEAPLDFPNEEK